MTTTKTCVAAILRHALLASMAAVALAPTTLLAQAAPSAAPDAATLAKYDRNQNGRLDPEEVAAREADERAARAAVATAATDGGAIVELSPFQVTGENDKGYYASNTLSGTRINSKLEDLGASITVVTKQQMQDFALLDINDVFMYEANTEGTANYTDVTIDRNGVVTDNVAGNPNNANRVRGIGAANQTRGNFETSGRVPFDPSNLDAVEISRGANSNIFGLGNGSGTVNIIPASANLTRESTTLEFRTDDLGSMRAMVEFNRPIVRNKLALRASVVHQSDEFVRQPSFNRADRYNVMAQYRPFKNTTIRASWEHYENYARRPNAIMPRDGISYWQSVGRPTWNPSTWTVTRNGVKEPPVPYNTNQGTETGLLGIGLQSAGTSLARPILFIDQGRVTHWSTGYISGIPAPTTAVPNPIPTPDFHPNSGHQRFVESATAPRAPLAPTAISISDKSVYDWTKINVAAANWSEDEVNTYMAELDHVFVNSSRHVLAVQLGWFREDAKRYNRSFIGTGGESPMLVMVDVNETYLDGRPNPNFLRPYVNSFEPTISRSPLKRDIERAQIAYKLNLSQEKSWVRWLGDNAFSAYGEYKETDSAGYSFRDVIISNHAWLPAGTNRGASVTRASYRYYLGDNQGQNIEYGSAAWASAAGTHPFNWYNAGTGQWVAEPTTIGEGFQAGNRRRANVIRTYGVVTQNHLLDDRIVTTFGIRKDSNFNRNASATQTMPDALTPNYETDDIFTADWFRRDGTTKTKGAVVKPFRSWRAIDRHADSGRGVVRFGAETLRSLNFHYNQSDSFRPETIAQNLNLLLLPNPTSETEDYGISVNLFNKFVLRFNMYESTQVNSRTGDAGTIATRAGRLDFVFGGNNDQFNLQRQARAWLTDANGGDPTLLQPENTQKLTETIAAAMKLPVGKLALMNAYPIAETSDVVSKGKEIEISYNPTNWWTTKVTGAYQEVVEQNVTPGIQDYIDARRPVWETIIDTRTGLPWFTTRYGSQGTPIDFLNGSVLAPYKLLRATEGKSRPQIRQWRFNALTNVRLSGISENKWLRRTSVSGAVRWESKGSIGYYAYDNDPNAFDPSRVIYDKAHTYVDGGLSYTSRIYKDKINMRVQLNIRNLFENGRLQPVGALPDGRPHSYRIVDPRTFILTTSFTL